MESDLRNLIGKYGMRAVHEGLMKEMRDTFQYLQDVFAVKNEIVHPVHHHVVPTVEVVNDVIPEGFHNETVEEEDSLAEEETVAEMPQDPTIKQVSITARVAKGVVETPSSPKNKDVKQLDRIEVEKKRQELVSKGIKPESLLTEENLKQWLGEGKSYNVISKETGVKYDTVRALAMSFGLSSNISKYKGIIAKKKKDGNKSS